MKVLFCAYRDWAKRVFKFVRKHPRISQIMLADSKSCMEMYLDHLDVSCGNITLSSPFTPDIVLLCGWSDPPSKKIVESGIPIFTEHPAASDRYSPGTPLQNQILDGLTTTKHRLVKVGYPELSLRQYSHEVDMDLAGSMDDVLFQMEATSRVLFYRFLSDYPNLEWKTWDPLPEEEQKSRRTPEMSKITPDDLKNLNTKQIYDRIRCLEDPYPNAFIEDDEGIVYFERARYRSKK